MSRKKLKTHSAAKKRFKFTKQKGILHKRPNKSHLLEKKSSSRKRSLRNKVLVPSTKLKEIKKMLNLK